MTRKCPEFHQASQISRNRGRGGFSAAELLVVVAMLGLLAAVSLPIFAATIKNARLSGAVRQLAGDIRSARSLAVSKGEFLWIQTNNVIGWSTAVRYRLSTTWTLGARPTVSRTGKISRVFIVGHHAERRDGARSAAIFNAMGVCGLQPTSSRSVNITLADARATRSFRLDQPVM
jgi:type II secretory pathway pseudopilin PulG